MTESDKGLLQMAAKAAGYRTARVADNGAALLLGGVQGPWNPLADDADALQLMLGLAIHLRFAIDCSIAYAGSVYAKQFVENNVGDTGAAARRAIVRAAAEIGAKME